MMIYIAIFVILIILFGLFLLGFFAALQKNKYSQADLSQFKKYYSQILHEKDLRHAIMNADKLLDLALKKRGYSGSVADKMKASKFLYSDYDGLWKAHKIRNKIAHEMDYQLSEKDARMHLKLFEKAFKDLKII